MILLLLYYLINSLNSDFLMFNYFHGKAFFALVSTDGASIGTRHWTFITLMQERWPKCLMIMLMNIKRLQTKSYTIVSKSVLFLVYFSFIGVITNYMNLYSQKNLWFLIFALQSIKTSSNYDSPLVVGTIYLDYWIGFLCCGLIQPLSSLLSLCKVQAY